MFEEKCIVTAIEEALPDYEIKFDDIEKPNGITYKGLLVRKKGEYLACCINLDDVPEGMSFDQTVDYVVGNVFMARSHTPDLGIENNNVEEFKKNLDKHIKIVLYPMKDESTFKDYFYEKLAEDIAVVYKYAFNEDAEAILRKEMFPDYTLEGIKEIAYKNAPVNFKPDICTLLRKMNDMNAEIGAPLIKEEDNLVYVSTRDGYHGAGAILYPEVQERLYNYFEGDYFIIPASVHEMLCINCKDTSFEEVSTVCREINRDIVNAEDYLSDTILRYDGNTKTIVKA